MCSMSVHIKGLYTSVAVYHYMCCMLIVYSGPDSVRSSTWLDADSCVESC